MTAALVAERMGQIHQICRDYRVERLYLFGSAVNGEMRPDSDMDFLVEFQDGAQEHFRPLLRMGAEMEDLFGRKVDLVEPRLITDAEFLQELEETKYLIYESGNPGMKLPPPRTPRTPQEKEKVVNRKIRNYLHDIYEAAQDILQFAAGRTEGDYLADRMLHHAIERAMSIICEAMRAIDRYSPEVAARFTDYRNIIGFRTLLVHHYAKLDDRKTWSFVEGDIPTLATEAEELLNQLGWPPDSGASD